MSRSPKLSAEHLGRNDETLTTRQALFLKNILLSVFDQYSSGFCAEQFERAKAEGLPWAVCMKIRDYRDECVEIAIKGKKPASA